MADDTLSQKLISRVFPAIRLSIVDHGMNMQLQASTSTYIDFDHKCVLYHLPAVVLVADRPSCSGGPELHPAEDGLFS
jgi:hypothetical protein